MTRLEEKFNPGSKVEKDLPRDVFVIKKKNCLACAGAGCLLVVLIILGLIFSLAVGLAKTGLVDLPFFSRTFYELPKPTRVLTEIQLGSTLSPKRLDQKLEEKVSKSQGAGSVVTLDFTEEELTLLLRTLSEELSTPESGFRVEDLQVVITPQELEIFGQFYAPDEPARKIALTLGVLPQVANGQLGFEITKIKLGSLAMPRSLGNFILRNFLEDRLQEFSEVLAVGMRFQSIELAEGRLVIQGERVGE